MDFSSNFSYQFYELILGKSEDILRRDEEMLFKVSCSACSMDLLIVMLQHAYINYFLWHSIAYGIGVYSKAK